MKTICYIGGSLNYGTGRKRPRAKFADVGNIQSYLYRMIVNDIIDSRRCLRLYRSAIREHHAYSVSTNARDDPGAVLADIEKTVKFFGLIEGRLNSSETYAKVRLIATLEKLPKATEIPYPESWTREKTEFISDKCTMSLEQPQVMLDCSGYVSEIREDDKVEFVLCLPNGSKLCRLGDSQLFIEKGIYYLGAPFRFVVKKEAGTISSSMVVSKSDKRNVEGFQKHKFDFSVLEEFEARENE